MACDIFRAQRSTFILQIQKGRYGTFGSDYEKSVRHV